MSIVCGCFGDCKAETRDETDGGKGVPLKYDANFKGPIRGKARRPKDLLCLGIFLAFIILMLSIAIYAWVNGEPQRIIYPTDSRGRLCGIDEGVKNKPNLLFFDLTRCASAISLTDLLNGDLDTSELFTCPTPQVCVEDCPDENEHGVRNNPVCVDEVDTSRYANLTDVDLEDIASIDNTAGLIADLLNDIANERCAPYYLVSTDVANRCVPTLVDLEDEFDEFINLTADENLQAALENQTSGNVLNDFGELVYTVNLEAIVNGSFIQAFLSSARQFALDVYRDFEVVWPALIIGVGLCVLFSFLYILLMRFFAGVIIWTGIIACFLGIAFISAFSFYQWFCFQETADIFDDFDPENNSTTVIEFLNTTETLAGQICLETDVFRQWVDSALPWFKYQEETWLAIAIIALVFLVGLFLILLVLCKRIRISIAIIKQASRAIAGVPTSVFYPIMTWVFLISLFIYWGVVALYLVASSEARYAIIMNTTIDEDGRNLTEAGLGVVENGTECDQEIFIEEYGNITLFVPEQMVIGSGAAANDIAYATITCQFEEYITTNFLLGLQLYHLFGLFWLGNFILALGECTLAGAFASWYWAWKKPQDVPTFALIQSFGRALLFHSGSLAFGSLIIALLQLIRYILTYLQKKLKNRTGKVVKYILCILKCCFYCLEKFLRYINRQAYIEIAIYGYDFCTAACKAIKLLVRNILITAVKDRIVAFLLFLGKIAIVCLIGILAYLGFGPYEEQGRALWGQPLNYYLIPVMVLVVAAFFIASGFMDVYRMAVDTIFICALEDLERNNGYDKPYFMTDELKSLLNVDNKDSPDGGETLHMESLETVNA